MEKFKNIQVKKNTLLEKQNKKAFLKAKIIRQELKEQIFFDDWLVIL